MRTTDSAMRLWVLPALIAAAMASATPGWCQGSLGGLTGRVTDASGAPVAGVTVKIENLETSAELQVSTTTDGDYLAPSLSPGRYRVTVSQRGFKTSVQEPVTVSTATVSKVDFTLDV